MLKYCYHIVLLSWHKSSVWRDLPTWQAVCVSSPRASRAGTCRPRGCRSWHRWSWRPAFFLGGSVNNAGLFNNLSLFQTVCTATTMHFQGSLCIRKYISGWLYLPFGIEISSIKLLCLFFDFLRVGRCKFFPKD